MAAEDTPSHEHEYNFSKIRLWSCTTSVMTGAGLTVQTSQ